jgi:plasmid stabilization system protein ParE
MPSAKPFRFHPEALSELENAADWYMERSTSAGTEFLRSVSDAIDKICEAPLRWSEHIYGTRRFVLQHFPFCIFYSDNLDGVNIVAIAHTSRKPGYWKQRV